MVKNPKRTVPLAAILGIGLAGIVYIAATQVLSGMYPSSVIAVSGASFATSASATLSNQVTSLASAFTAFACLISLGPWVMLVGQAGVRAVDNGNFPKVYGEVDSNGILKKDLLLVAAEMTTLIIPTILMNFVGGKASDLSSELTGIAVLLTMLPCFYSYVDLIRLEDVGIRNLVSLIRSVPGCVFRFIMLVGASFFESTGTFIVSLVILMFCACKMYEHQSHLMDNHTVSNAH